MYYLKYLYKNKYKILFKNSIEQSFQLDLNFFLSYQVHDFIIR